MDICLCKSHLNIYKCITIIITYVPSDCNPADAFSRKLTASDSMLAPKAWDRVQELFGGARGHNLDLMSLNWNVQCDQDSKPLPHFTPYLTPASAGVDVFSQDLLNSDGLKTNAYCFPPFTFIQALLCFLQSQKAIATVGVPGFSPRSTWWPTIVAMSSRGVTSKHGFRPTSFPFDLWVFRVDRF